VSAEQREKLEAAARQSAFPVDSDVGVMSPIFADLSGLPPLIIQAGTHEVLLDDAARLARQVAAADVEVTADIPAGVPHVFPSFTRARRRCRTEPGGAAPVGISEVFPPGQVRT
jgi:acetyl esterase/lipase